MSLFGWVLALGLAAVVPGLCIYLWYKYKDDVDVSQNDFERQRIHKLEQELREYKTKESDIKKCPLCALEIDRDSVFCKSCGGNVKEHEEELSKIKRQKFEETGIIVLLDDEKIAAEATLTKKMYGKEAYIRFLKRKAKEMGYGDIEITEEDVD